MLPVPIVRQCKPYSCGAAALLACLLYWKAWTLDAPESALHAELGTNADTGTEPGPICKVARTHGLTAQYRSGLTVADLRRCLERGDTVILALQAWPGRVVSDWSDVWDDGHYVVLVGMTDDAAVLMDPSTYDSYTTLDLVELEQRWHDLDARRRKLRGMGIAIRGREHIASFPDTPKRLG